MNKIFLSTFVAAAFAVGANAQVLIGSSSGSQYTTATWTNGAPNAFAGWFIVNGGGGALNNISDSTQNGRTSIGSQSFFIVGGTNGSFIDVYAPLGGLLASGQSISLSANYSWTSGTRGIEFTSSGELFRFEHSGSDALFLKGTGITDTEISANVFNQALTYNVSYSNATSVNIGVSLFGNSTPFFTTNVTVANMPNEIKFYVGGITDSSLANQNNYGLYFNAVTTVPEPSTYALLALSAAAIGGYAARRRARK
jgi:hypothetical protein